MKTLNDLKMLIGYGLIAFEHGFIGPKIRRKYVWGVDENNIYCGGKLSLNKLTNAEINLLYSYIENYFKIDY